MSNFPEGDPGCCEMGRHFVVAVIGRFNGTTTPSDVADFMVMFEPPALSIKYCPFCGFLVTGPRAVTLLKSHV